MKTITAQELKSKLDNGESLQLIDVREDYEYDTYNIGGVNIPLDNVLTSTEQIDKDKPVIFCCKSGKRSKAITLALTNKLGLDNLYTLSGGVEGYQETVG